MEVSLGSEELLLREPICTCFLREICSSTELRTHLPEHLGMHIAILKHSQLRAALFIQSLREQLPARVNWAPNTRALQQGSLQVLLALMLHDLHQKNHVNTHGYVWMRVIALDLYGCLGGAGAGTPPLWFPPRGSSPAALAAADRPDQSWGAIAIEPGAISFRLMS